MRLPYFLRYLPPLALVSLVLFEVKNVSWAQKAPAPAASLSPTLTAPFPLGVQRGTTAELVLGGTNLTDPTYLWTTFPAKTQFKEEKSGTKAIVKLEVPADAPLGFHGIRLATTKGVSNLKLFCVDELPQVVENDKNNKKETAQSIPVPCVVAGKTEAESSDWYKIAAQSGQQLSFDVLGRRLGMLIDPQLSIYNAKTGRELAHDNDSPGCQNDPRLRFTFPDAGDYLIEVRDVLARGGADYGYRLRIGDFPLATSTFPLAGKRGDKIKVTFAGPHVGGAEPVDVQVPSDPNVNVVYVTPKSAKGVSGWPVPLLATNMNEALEQEPNNQPAKAQKVAIPGAVSGRFLDRDDIDYFLFSAKKGQKVQIEAQTYEVGSPTLTFLTVKNAKTGAELAKSNPQAPVPNDQKFEFDPKEDGEYLLEVQHLTYAHGPNEAYRLMLQPTSPTFELNVVSDKAEIVPGSGVPLLVQVVRKGYTGPIDLKVVGSSNLSGSTTFKAGQVSGVLLLQAKPDVPMGLQAIQVQGQAKEVPGVVLAGVKSPVSQALSGLGYPPLALLTQVGVGIRERGPVTLVAKLEFPEASPGTVLNVTLTAKRDKGFTDEIAVNPPVGLPATVPAPKIPPIPKDKDEIKFTIDLNAKTAVGDYVLFFSGKTKQDKKDVNVGSEPLVLQVGAPFDLRLEPGALSLAPGSKSKIQVVATRKTGYKGPIALEFRKLPAGVTASKAEIAMGKDQVDVDVAVDAKAAPVDKVEIDVNGTATALNNLAGASPPALLSVKK